MSFESEITDRTNLAEYERLKLETARIVNRTSQWMTAATNLHGIVTADKKAEIVALRNQLKTDLQAILNAN